MARGDVSESVDSTQYSLDNHHHTIITDNNFIPLNDITNTSHTNTTNNNNNNNHIPSSPVIPNPSLYESILMLEINKLKDEFTNEIVVLTTRIDALTRCIQHSRNNSLNHINNGNNNHNNDNDIKLNGNGHNDLLTHTRNDTDTNNNNEDNNKLLLQQHDNIINQQQLRINQLDKMIHDFTQQQSSTNTNTSTTVQQQQLNNNIESNNTNNNASNDKKYRVVSAEGQSPIRSTTKAADKYDMFIVSCAAAAFIMVIAVAITNLIR